jgi:hypothetical protein
LALSDFQIYAIAFAAGQILLRLFRAAWGCHFSTLSPNSNVLKASRSLLERLTDAVCYAA